MSFKRLFRVTIFSALGFGLFNIFVWFYLPEGTLIPMSYNGVDGFGDYSSKTIALINFPVLIFLQALVLKAKPYLKPWRKRIEDYREIIVAVWIGIIIILGAMQIVFVANAIT